VFLKNYGFAKALIEFGFPIGIHDASGARLIHLVDQNYWFLILLRKLLKKLATSVIQAQSPFGLKAYVKHPQRVKE
jgi:hypothetical protein